MTSAKAPTVPGGKPQPNPPPHVQPLTPELLKQQLGYPDIYVKPEEREKVCPNCGMKGHDETECKVPTMEKLFEEFGPKLFDSSPNACDEKKRIIRKYFDGDKK